VVGFTMLQGFAGIFSGLAAAVALFVMRFMVGLAESPSFPANARIVAAWFPDPSAARRRRSSTRPSISRWSPSPR
jgi:MFS family permease